MSSGAPARSISSDRVGGNLPWRRYLRLIWDTVGMVAKMRIQGMGVPGYFLTWLTLPLMEMLLLAFIYQNDRELLEYAVVASAGLAILFALIFNGGEILDGERRRGTLGNLFLAPLPRYVWLGGFQLFALIEAVVNASIAVGAGAWFFDIDLSVNVLTLIVTVALLTASLWGMSLILGAFGIVARNANFLSNLIFPFVMVIAGTWYPVALMPDWIRIPARALPFSYGIEALVAALTRNASVSDLTGTLVPLLGFAIVLPLIGVAIFRFMEHAVRKIGSLEVA